MKRVLHCLNGSISHGFFLHCQTLLTLHVFSNVNWVRDFDTHFSTFTYVAFLGANFISWSFKEQPTVARSFTKAEYHAIIFVVVEINQIQHLLQELYIPSYTPPTIYYDNMRTIYLSFNPMFHFCIKHIVIDYHLVCNQVLKHLLRVCHVFSSNQFSDLLTKPFITHHAKLGIRSCTPTL